MSNLNPEQKTAYTGILENSGRSLLTAKGGCGKSYVTARVILDAAKSGTHVTIVAPSHTARSVLERELTKQSGDDMMWGGCRDRIVTMTVAAAIGKRPDYTKAPKNYKDTPFVTIKNGGRIRENCPADKPRLLIIEEISMVGKEDLDAMLFQWGKAPILKVGDFRQIPPVNAKSSRPYLISEYKAKRLKHFKLEKNMRSASDTDIAEFSDKVFGKGCKPFDGDYRGVIKYDDVEAFEKEFNRLIHNGDDAVTAIAYRNNTVNRYMAMGAGGEVVDIKAGDIVRLHEGITIDYQDMNGKWQKENVANNGDIVGVLDYQSDGLVFNHPLCDTPIPYGVVTLDIPHPDPFNHGSNVQLMVPAKITDGANGGKNGAYGKLFGQLLAKVTKAGLDLEDGNDESDAVMEFIDELGGFDTGVPRIFEGYENRFGKGSEECNKFKRNLLFGRCFFGVRGEFVNLTKLYSLTAHKSQGQSIPIVFADLRDIKSANSDEVKHLAYVACSRAIKELHVLY